MWTAITREVSPALAACELSFVERSPIDVARAQAQHADYCRALEALVNAGALDALGRNRASLMLQVPEAMKATEQLVRSAKPARFRCSAAAAAKRPRWKCRCRNRAPWCWAASARA